MKIDEVMLGDVVSVSGRPIHVTLAVLNHWSDNIKPIPLTHEILEKIGFKLNDVVEDGYCIYYGIYNRVHLCNDKKEMNSDNEWYVHIKNEDYRTIVNCELTYVHEFQHLLKLCKIDRWIVL